MESERIEGEPIGCALAAWRAEVEVPPDFQAGVWSRIRRREERRAGRWLWFTEAVAWLLGDIRLAAALPVVALAAGFLLGFWHVREPARDDRTQFHVAYVDSLDPYVLAARHMEGP